MSQSKGNGWSRLSGAFALVVGLAFWAALALGSNYLVNAIMKDQSDPHWLRWQRTIVLVVTLFAAWWAALRVVNKPEDFLEDAAKEEPKAAR